MLELRPALKSGLAGLDRDQREVQRFGNVRVGQNTCQHGLHDFQAGLSRDALGAGKTWLAAASQHAGAHSSAVLQILSNRTALHSRTEYEDFEQEDRKRTLYRLWQSTPDSLSLPEGWQHFYGTREAGVLGGIKGQHYDDSCRAFDASQSAELGVNRNGNVS